MFVEIEKPSEEWIITHQFDHSPRVDCWVSVQDVDVKIIPSCLDKIDEHTIKICFLNPYKGRVKLTSSKAWNVG